MIFFTSDLHLGHANIIKIKNRPFADITEMDEALTDNINSICTSRDTLVILGDLAFRQSPEKTEEKLRQMNPKLVLVRGNHDADYDRKYFLAVKDYLETGLYNRKVVMSHYPFLEWNGYFRKSLHLHGHQHNGPEYNLQMREQGILRYDVGVDANDYKPVSALQIFEFFGLDTDDFGNSMKHIMW